MIRAKIPQDTKHFTINGVVHCSYCGKEIQPDTEIDHHETCDYYHCDCKDAQKELWVRKECKRVTEECRKQLEDLGKQYPKEKFKAETVETIVSID